jgi:membrane-bound serine protease (ClpP class)
MLIALIRVVLPLGTAFLLFILFGKNLFKSRAMRGFVLNDTQAATLSYHDTRAELNALVNQTGIAITVLRPSGQVEIASERYDAMAEGGMIEGGEAIRVVDVSGNTLVVRKVS